MVYTFILREDVKFHNGKTMTAEDVVWSFNHTMNSKNSATGYTNLLVVQNIEALDKYTVKVTLNTITPSFLENMVTVGIVPILPANSISEGTLAKIDAPPPGTGPFVFDNWVPESEINYKSNKDYWRGIANLDRIHFIWIPDDAVRLSALRSGDIHLAFEPGQINILRIQRGEIPAVHLLSGGYSTANLGFNTEKPPFNNVKMRQAIAYAIDTKEMIKEVSWGLTQETNILLIPGTKWNPIAGLNSYDRDIAKSKQLAKEAGYNGEPIEILDRRGREDLYEFIVRQLTEAGFNIKMTITESGVWEDRRSKGDFQITYAGAAAGASPFDSEGRISLLYLTEKAEYKSGNRARWSDPKTDDLFNKLLTTLDSDKSYGYYKELIKHLNEQIPYYPLELRPRIHAASDKLMDMELSSMGSLTYEDGGLLKAWLDE